MALKMRKVSKLRDSRKTIMITGKPGCLPEQSSKVAVCADVDRGVIMDSLTITIQSCSSLKIFLLKGNKEEET